MDLITVIVPIYKVEDYLERCIKSLLVQSHEYMEIILVNDGSPDNCGEICDKFSARDKRIKVIHKENGGYSSARNAGLSIASGDYIGFVDGDDFVHPDMYKKLLSAHKGCEVDMICCDFERVDRGGMLAKRGIVKFKSPDYSKIYSGAEYIKMLLDYEHSSYCWDKLYSRKFLASTKFEEGFLAEDLLFFFKLLKADSKIMFLPHRLYYYTVREDSVTSGFNEMFFLDRVRAAFLAEEILKGDFQELSQEIKSFQLRMIASFLTQMPTSFIRARRASYLYVIERLYECKENIKNSKLSVFHKLFLYTFPPFKRLANYGSNLLIKALSFATRIMNI